MAFNLRMAPSTNRAEKGYSDFPTRHPWVVEHDGTVWLGEKGEHHYDLLNHAGLTNYDLSSYGVAHPDRGEVTSYKSHPTGSQEIETMVAHKLGIEQAQPEQDDWELDDHYGSTEIQVKEMGGDPMPDWTWRRPVFYDSGRRMVFVGIPGTNHAMLTNQGASGLPGFININSPNKVVPIGLHWAAGRPPAEHAEIVEALRSIEPAVEQGADHLDEWQHVDKNVNICKFCKRPNGRAIDGAPCPDCRAQMLKDLDDPEKSQRWLLTHVTAFSVPAHAQRRVKSYVEANAPNTKFMPGRWLVVMPETQENLNGRKFSARELTMINDSLLALRLEADGDSAYLVIGHTEDKPRTDARLPLAFRGENQRRMAATEALQAVAQFDGWGDSDTESDDELDNELDNELPEAEAEDPHPLDTWQKGSAVVEVSTEGTDQGYADRRPFLAPKSDPAKIFLGNWGSHHQEILDELEDDQPNLVYEMDAYDGAIFGAFTQSRGATIYGTPSMQKEFQPVADEVNTYLGWAGQAQQREKDEWMDDWEPDMSSFSKTANTHWEPNNWGKGILHGDELHTWPTDYDDGTPWHATYADSHRIPAYLPSGPNPDVTFFRLNPNNTLMPYPSAARRNVSNEELLQRVQQAHPEITHVDEGYSDRHEEEWSDHFAKAAQSTIEHKHVTRGHPCRCSFGHHLIKRKMSKTAAKVDWLKQRQEAGDKWLNSEDGQRFMDFAKNTSPEEVDPLLPWIARELKKGRMTMNQWDWPAAADEWENGAINMNHLADWYNSDSPTRKGVDIMQLTTPQLREKINEWDEELAAKMEEEQSAPLTQGGEVVHKFDDDWTIRKLKTAQDCQAEGDAMGHCVGGYGDQVENQDTLIYSLRDHKGKPHATWEIQPDHFQKHPAVENWFEKALDQNETARHFPDYLKKALLQYGNARETTDALDLHEEKFGDNQANYPGSELEEVYQQLYNRNRELNVGPEGGEVIQIQGKQNQEPNDEYKQRIAQWFQRFPDEHRPSASGESITHVGQLRDNDDPYYDSVKNPESYGLDDNRYVDWEGIHNSMLDYGWNNQYFEPSDFDNAYELALKKGEVTEFGKHFEDFQQREQDNFDRETMDYYDGPPMPDPDDFDTAEEYEAAETAHYEALDEYRDEQAQYHPGMQAVNYGWEKLNPHYHPTKGWVHNPVGTFARTAEVSPPKVIEGQEDPESTYEMNRRPFMYHPQSGRMWLAKPGASHADLHREFNLPNYEKSLNKGEYLYGAHYFMDNYPVFYASGWNEDEHEVAIARALGCDEWAHIGQKELDDHWGDMHTSSWNPEWHHEDLPEVKQTNQGREHHEGGEPILYYAPDNKVGIGPVGAYHQDIEHLVGINYLDALNAGVEGGQRGGIYAGRLTNNPWENQNKILWYGSPPPHNKVEQALGYDRVEVGENDDWTDVFDDVMQPNEDGEGGSTVFSKMTPQQQQRAWQQAEKGETEILHQFDDGYTIKRNSPEAARGVGQFMRNCWQGITQEPVADCLSLHDENDLPQVAFLRHRGDPKFDVGTVDDILGHRNNPPKSDHHAKIMQWAKSKGHRIAPGYDRLDSYNYEAMQGNVPLQGQIGEPVHLGKRATTTLQQQTLDKYEQDPYAMLTPVKSYEDGSIQVVKAPRREYRRMVKPRRYLLKPTGELVDFEQKLAATPEVIRVNHQPYDSEEDWMDRQTFIYHPNANKIYLGEPGTHHGHITADPRYQKPTYEDIPQPSGGTITKPVDEDPMHGWIATDPQGWFVSRGVAGWGSDGTDIPAHAVQAMLPHLKDEFANVAKEYLNNQQTPEEDQWQHLTSRTDRPSSPDRKSPRPYIHAREKLTVTDTCPTCGDPVTDYSCPRCDWGDYPAQDATKNPSAPFQDLKIGPHLAANHQNSWTPGTQGRWMITLDGTVHAWNCPDWVPTHNQYCDMHNLSYYDDVATAGYIGEDGALQGYGIPPDPESAQLLATNIPGTHLPKDENEEDEWGWLNEHGPLTPPHHVASYPDRAIVFDPNGGAIHIGQPGSEHAEIYAANPDLDDLSCHEARATEEDGQHGVDFYGQWTPDHKRKVMNHLTKQFGQPVREREETEDEWGEILAQTASTKMYHGTKYPHGEKTGLVPSAWDETADGIGEAIWLTPDIEEAKLYGPTIYEVDVSGHKVHQSDEPASLSEGFSYYTTEKIPAERVRRIPLSSRSSRFPRFSPPVPHPPTSPRARIGKKISNFWKGLKSRSTPRKESNPDALLESKMLELPVWPDIDQLTTQASNGFTSSLGSSKGNVSTFPQGQPNNLFTSQVDNHGSPEVIYSKLPLKDNAFTWRKPVLYDVYTNKVYVGNQGHYHEDLINEFNLNWTDESHHGYITADSETLEGAIGQGYAPPSAQPFGWLSTPPENAQQVEQALGISQSGGRDDWAEISSLSKAEGPKGIPLNGVGEDSPTEMWSNHHIAQESLPRVMFHVAPASARKDIEQSGLKGSEYDQRVWQKAKYPMGVYLWPSLEDASPGALSGLPEGEKDIWAIDTQGLSIRPDPITQKAFLSDDPIPPNRLQWVHDKHWYYTDEDSEPFEWLDQQFRSSNSPTEISDKFTHTASVLAQYPAQPPAVMYHVAPSRLSEDIESGGLVPGEQRFDQSHPAGIYLYDKYEDAYSYALAFGWPPNDIWEVNVAGLPVQPDPENAPDFHYDGRWFHPGPIPAERVSFVEDNEPDWEDDSEKYSRNDHIGQGSLREWLVPPGGKEWTPGQPGRYMTFADGTKYRWPHQHPDLHHDDVRKALGQPWQDAGYLDPETGEPWDGREDNAWEHLGASEPLPSIEELAPHRWDRECYEVAAGIANQWPHLKEDAGFYVHPELGAGDHGWNITPDGTIIDMSATQHNYQGEQDEQDEGYEFPAPEHPEIIPPGHPYYDRYVSWTRHQDRAQIVAHEKGYHQSPQDGVACPLCQKKTGASEPQFSADDITEFYGQVISRAGAQVGGEGEILVFPEGQVKLDMDISDQGAVEVHNIEAEPQGAGLGNRVMQAIYAVCKESGNPVRLFDLRPDAMPFWKKQPVEIEENWDGGEQMFYGWPKGVDKDDWYRRSKTSRTVGNYEPGQPHTALYVSYPDNPTDNHVKVFPYRPNGQPVDEETMKSQYMDDDFYWDEEDDDDDDYFSMTPDTFTYALHIDPNGRVRSTDSSPFNDESGKQVIEQRVALAHPYWHTNDEENFERVAIPPGTWGEGLAFEPWEPGATGKALIYNGRLYEWKAPPTGAPRHIDAVEAIGMPKGRNMRNTVRDAYYPEFRAFFEIGEDGSLNVDRLSTVDNQPAIKFALEADPRLKLPGEEEDAWGHISSAQPRVIEWTTEQIGEAPMRHFDSGHTNQPWVYLPKKGEIHLGPPDFYHDHFFKAVEKASGQPINNDEGQQYSWGVSRGRTSDLLTPNNYFRGDNSRNTAIDRLREHFGEEAPTEDVWEHLGSDDKTTEWLSAADEFGHDYDPGWDYEPDEERANHPFIEQGREIAKAVHPYATVHPVRGLDKEGVVAKYVNGTYKAPVMVVDFDALWNSADPEGEMRTTVHHELRHAQQDYFGEEMDEDDAESFGRQASPFLQGFQDDNSWRVPKDGPPTIHEYSPEDMYFHDEDGTPVELWDLGDDQWQKRKPLVYDYDNHALHIGPLNYTHGQVERAAETHGRPVSFAGRSFGHGWIGPNPESSYNDAPENFGWYSEDDEGILEGISKHLVDKGYVPHEYAEDPWGDVHLSALQTYDGNPVKWTPDMGVPGKGFLDTDGNLHTWHDSFSDNRQTPGPWTHGENKRWRGVETVPMSHFYVAPDGTLTSHTFGYADSEDEMTQKIIDASGGMLKAENADEKPDAWGHLASAPYEVVLPEPGQKGEGDLRNYGWRVPLVISENKIHVGNPGDYHYDVFRHHGLDEGTEGWISRPAPGELRWDAPANVGAVYLRDNYSTNTHEVADALKPHFPDAYPLEDQDDEEGWSDVITGAVNNNLQWSGPGEYGKGFLDGQLKLHTWDDNDTISPWTHSGMANERGVTVGVPFYIEPNGEIDLDFFRGEADLVQLVTQQDPRLQVKRVSDNDEWQHLGSTPSAYTPYGTEVHEGTYDSKSFADWRRPIILSQGDEQNGVPHKFYIGQPGSQHGDLAMEFGDHLPSIYWDGTAKHLTGYLSSNPPAGMKQLEWFGFKPEEHVHNDIARHFGLDAPYYEEEDQWHLGSAPIQVKETQGEVDFADHPGAPLIYSPQSNTIYKGQDGWYHWNIIEKEPELSKKYGPSWNGAPSLSTGDIHGRIMDGEVRWYNSKPGQKDALNQALGYDPDAVTEEDDEWADDFLSTFSRTADDAPNLIWGTRPQEDEDETKWLKGRHPVVYHKPTNSLYIGQEATHHQDIHDEFGLPIDEVSHAAIGRGVKGWEDGIRWFTQEHDEVPEGASRRLQQEFRISDLGAFPSAYPSRHGEPNMDAWDDFEDMSHLAASEIEIIESENPPGNNQQMMGRQPIVYDATDKKAYLGPPATYHATLYSLYNIKGFELHHGWLADGTHPRYSQGIGWYGSPPEDDPSIRSEFAKKWPHAVQDSQKTERWETGWDDFHMGAVNRLVNQVIEGTVPKEEGKDDTWLTRRPFLYDRRERNIYVGQPGTYHRDIDSEFKLGGRDGYLQPSWFVQGYIATPEADWAKPGVGFYNDPGPAIGGQIKDALKQSGHWDGTEATEEQNAWA